MGENLVSWTIGLLSLAGSGVGRPLIGSEGRGRGLLWLGGLRELVLMSLWWWGRRGLGVAFLDS